VLHTWGSALTHHPHVHGIVPGGGIALDGTRWVACRRGFFLPVRVLSRLFRGLFCEKLSAAHRAGKLKFFGEHSGLGDAQAFFDYAEQQLRQAALRPSKALTEALHYALERREGLSVTL
jgi:hypothetical protein